MKRTFLALLMMPLAAQAETLPPGLVDARLLPGWIDDQGHRITALELVLEPGWKTYWRSPGDSGIPPSFDWQGSDNLGEVRFHWPAPEIITSGDSLSFGFHDRMILPVEIIPAQAGQPVTVAATVDFGLCENICVPAHVELQAGAPSATPDPAIQAALDRQPAISDRQPECRIERIEDGLRLGITLADAADVRGLAVELPGRPEVWVSAPDLSQDGQGGILASADLVPPEAKPFDLDPAGLRFTLIGDQPAVELQGCDAS